MARFRLQQLLDLRRRREEALQQRLALAVQARVQAEAALDTIEKIAARQDDVLRQAVRQGTLDVATVQACARARDACRLAAARRQEEVERCRAFEEAERARLARATAERKALDRLKERHLEHERAEERRREALLLDDIAATRAARAAAGGGGV